MTIKHHRYLPRDFKAISGKSIFLLDNWIERVIRISLLPVTTKIPHLYNIHVNLIFSSRVAIHLKNANRATTYVYKIILVHVEFIIVAQSEMTYFAKSVIFLAARIP